MSNFIFLSLFPKCKILCLMSKGFLVHSFSINPLCPFLYLTYVASYAPQPFLYQSPCYSFSLDHSYCLISLLLWVSACRIASSRVSCLMSLFHCLLQEMLFSVCLCGFLESFCSCSTSQIVNVMRIKTKIARCCKISNIIPGTTTTKSKTFS